MGIIRKTASVDVLLNEFEKSSSAISVAELTKRLRTTINKSTIYRVLDKLEEDGYVHSFLGNDGNKWYAKCQGCTKTKHTDIHPHFQCVECGKVDCLSVVINLPPIPNRHITASQVLLQGTCDTCHG